MSSYQYGSTIFQTYCSAVIAMTEDYLLAGGLNNWDTETVREALADPASTADAMIAIGWNSLLLVGQRDEDGEQASEPVSRDDLLDAVADIRDAVRA